MSSILAVNVPAMSQVCEPSRKVLECEESSLQEKYETSFADPAIRDVFSPFPWHYFSFLMHTLFAEIV